MAGNRRFFTIHSSSYYPAKHRREATAAPGYIKNSVV